MLKIAAIESPECFFSKSQHHFFYHLTSSSSFTREMILRNTTSKSILNLTFKKNIEIACNDEQVIEQTNITQELKDNEIKHFFLSHRSSEKIENWAKENNFHLLRTPWDCQQKFEDKLFFDALLKENQISSPRSTVLNRFEDINTVPSYPAIVQYPWTDKPSATCLTGCKEELQERLLSGSSYPLLAREFIHGMPMGVSVLIGKSKIIFSAPRLQCFSSRKPLFSEFLGIHWLPSCYFSAKTKVNLNQNLRKLAGILQSKGFLGVANFDLVLKDDIPYFIECNPRMSSATPCFSLCPELIHGINFCDEFLKTMTGQNLSADIPFLPETNFEGSYIELGYWANQIARKVSPDEKIQSMPQNGFYRFEKKDPTFTSSLAEEFQQKNSLLFHSTSCSGTKVEDLKTMGVIFSNFPLITYKNDHSEYSSSGTKVLDFFLQQFVFRGPPEIL